MRKTSSTRTRRFYRSKTHHHEFGISRFDSPKFNGSVDDKNLYRQKMDDGCAKRYGNFHRQTNRHIHSVPCKSQWGKNCGEVKLCLKFNLLPHMAVHRFRNLTPSLLRSILLLFRANGHFAGRKSCKALN